MMNVIREISSGAIGGLSVTDSTEGLVAISEQGCAALIWHRTPIAGFQTWIDRLPPGDLPKLRIVLRPRNVRQTVLGICDQCGTPQTPERDWMINDIADLAERFAELMQAPYLRLRLDVIDSNACRRFHVDAITARLICTYRGTGTQYGVSSGDADPERIFTVPTGMPILLRGSDWPEHPRSGLVHRSPPIEGSGETRLLLVLDAIADLDDAEASALLH
ncbi:MAG: DUF1826 domain-containing protein [Pseudomonadota bacterium]